MLVASCYARPREEREVVEKRFGKPLSGPEGVRKEFTYQWKDFVVKVSFDGNLSGRETYQFANGQPFTEDQLNALLNDLRGALPLVDYKDAWNGARRWGFGRNTDHGSNSARLSPDGKTLTAITDMSAAFMDPQPKKPTVPASPATAK